MDRVQEELENKRLNAKNKVYDNLVATKQIKPADYVVINVATEVNV